jgi:hypothetical protein
MPGNGRGGLRQKRQQGRFLHGPRVHLRFALFGETEQVFLPAGFARVIFVIKPRQTLAAPRRRRKGGPVRRGSVRVRGGCHLSQLRREIVVGGFIHQVFDTSDASAILTLTIHPLSMIFLEVVQIGGAGCLVHMATISPDTGA